MGVYSSRQNHISPKFGQFEPFLAIFRYPEFLKIFPMLTYLWNTSRYNILHLMGVTVFSRISFYPNLANLGCFCPFLGTKSSWKFYNWLPNIERHQDVTFYTYFGGYCSLQVLISPNYGQFVLFWAVFGHFWVHKVFENFPDGYLT